MRHAARAAALLLAFTTGVWADATLSRVSPSASSVTTYDGHKITFEIRASGLDIEYDWWDEAYWYVDGWQVDTTSMYDNGSNFWSYTFTEQRDYEIKVRAKWVDNAWWRPYTEYHYTGYIVWRVSVNSCDPTVTRVSPDYSVSVYAGLEQRFVFRARDPGNDLSRAVWFLEGDEEYTQTISGGDTQRSRSYTLDTPGTHDVGVRVYDTHDFTDYAGWTVTVLSHDPSVSPVSPGSPVEFHRGDTVTFTAQATDPAGDLAGVGWYIGGELMSTGTLTGSSATATFTHTFNEDWPYKFVRAYVYHQADSDNPGIAEWAFQEIPTEVLEVSSGAGGTVTSPGEGTFEYDQGEVVMLTATPDEGYTFVEWSGSVSSSSNPLVLTMTNSYEVKANFRAEGPGVRQPLLYVLTRDGIRTVSSTGVHETLIDGHKGSYAIEIRAEKLYATERARGGDIRAYDLQGQYLGITGTPQEAKDYLAFVALPGDRFALLDNLNDKVFIINDQGTLLATALIRAYPDNSAQSVDGLVVGNRLIVSEDGYRNILQIDLTRYQVSVFKDLSALSATFLGAIAYADDTYYVCTDRSLYSFTEAGSPVKVAEVPEKNITGLVVTGESAYVSVNFAGKIYKIDLAGGAVSLLAAGLNYPIDLECAECEDDTYVAIAAGEGHSLALKADGTLVGWGDNEYGQASPPGGNDFIAVAASAAGYHSLALRSDGSIAAWGDDQYGQASAPAGYDFIAIAAGSRHSLALKSDGSIVAWGDNSNGQSDPPPGNDFIAIAAGILHSVALKSDGSIVAWGRDTFGQSSPPSGNDFVAIAGGGMFSLALQTDGSVVGWGGKNGFGQINPPAGNDFAAISAGRNHGLALKTDGSIVAWGNDEFGRASPPAGNDFVAIAGGGSHSLALKANGSIVAWGNNDHGQADPPVPAPSGEGVKIVSYERGL